MIRIASAHRLINLLRFKHRSGAEKCQLRAQNQTLDPSCRTPKNRSFVWRICQVPCVRIGGNSEMQVMAVLWGMMNYDH